MQQVLGAHQGRLDDVVRNIFGDVEITKNARKLAQIKNPYTSGYLELDLWVPKYNICFEFQDSYHYVTTWYFQAAVHQIAARDSLKTEALRRRNETLIIVPCWWDGSEDSLIATIQFNRPDIFESRSHAEPISCAPRSDFFKGNKIPVIGELMYASFPMSEQLVETLDAWWLGEKYDGVRVCWNGVNLYSRFGTILDIPRVQVVLFHNLLSLDCEFWFGRGLFVEAQRLITQTVEGSNSDWSMLRCIGFDQPSLSYNKSQFEYRYEWILTNISTSHPFVIIAPRICFKISQKLNVLLQMVIDGGGEGVVMRKPMSVYTHGRSFDLLKLKASRGDVEALTVAVHLDKSLTLRMPSGVTFGVGPESVLPGLKPNPGEVVSLSFENYSRRDIPTNPFVERIRYDLTWENVLQGYEESSHPQFLDESSSKVLGFSSKPCGYWSENENNNMRSFFVEYAHGCGWDPLIAQNWYSVKHNDILKHKGGRGVLANFNGSLKKALLSLFPEMKLDVSKFKVVPNRYWHDMKNKKHFFDMYAKVNKFDPLIPQNWYNISNKKLLQYKGCWSVLCYYNSIHAALSHVYPDIGLNKHNFKAPIRNRWKDTTVQRQFFINYAKRNKFDPFIASNWYHISTVHFTFEKGASTLLQIYQGSLAKALQTLFPEVAFDTKKFTRSLDAFWKSDNNKRAFFVHFAHTKGFDPLVPSNWYSVSRASITAHKAAKTVLSFFRGNYIRALIELFPNISFNKQMFDSAKSF